MYEFIFTADPISTPSKGFFTYYVVIFLNSQTEFGDQRSPQLVVANVNNIIDVTGTHIRGQKPPQFLVPKGHNILKVTDDYAICDGSLWPVRQTYSSRESKLIVTEVVE